MLPARILRASASACLRAKPTSTALRRPAFICAQKPLTCAPRHAFSTTAVRGVEKTGADEIIEEITELYGTARDEFEIATEETEKGTTYAAGDREAAREEMAKLKERYEEVLGGEHGEEVRRRIGGRIRELENAIGNLEP